MILLSLVARLASPIFVPLSTRLQFQIGWRAALGMVALLLLMVTVPLHASVLRRRPAGLGLMPDSRPYAAMPEQAARLLVHGPKPGGVVRRVAFWLLMTAVVLAASVLVAAVVHFVPFLIAQGHVTAYAAGLAGLTGVLQLPNRLVLAPLGR